MMRFLLYAALLFTPALSSAQPYNITKWQRNTTGKVATYFYNNGGMPITYTWTVTTDSADVLKVAYTTDSIWIRSNGLTDSMGKYLNPGGCTAQGYTHRFPRTPSVPATKTISPKGGAIGLLLNGIPIYGLGNSTSYTGSANANNGSGIWNVEVGKSEGFVLDGNYGAHPQQQGAYHSHDKPYRLYRDSGTTKHSPLIGYAFDGYPVYGPYGYATPLSSVSGISRMKTGYSLRNITTRTTLPVIPNGGGTASQTGPAVSTTYPIGTYVEDYEWLASNGGDLDAYNGRFCVTPEYPSGTYAYFVTIDATGTAAFPYYIGIYYYGQPVTANFPTTGGSVSNGLTIPATATIYGGGIPLAIRLLGFTGTATNAGNILQWRIVKNSGLQSMNVERSEDGRSFETVGTVAADENPISGEAGYSYTDSHPATLNYYRVRLPEANGDITYTSVIRLQRDAAGRARVYPTCTDGDLFVRTDAAAASRPDLAVYDALGRACAVSRELTDGLYRLDVGVLPPGAYILRMRDDNGVQSFRFFRK